MHKPLITSCKSRFDANNYSVDKKIWSDKYKKYLPEESLWIKKGLKYNEQMEILNSSDVIVLNIDQGIKTIEHY